MSFIFVLTPSESKRLIAKAVVSMPIVQKALKNGRIIISNGTTNAFIVEEILSTPISKYKYSAGIISEGKLAVVPREERLNPVVLVNGKPVNVHPKDIINEFTADDVVIKGANAVDNDRNVGILLQSPTGGTIALVIGVVSARGSHLIVAVGLEKLVPSVRIAESKCGQGKLKYSTGEKVGMMMISNANVVTEIEALKILTGVNATHIASGGINGSEGSVTLVAEGDDSQIEKTFELINNIKGELPIVKE